MCGCVCASTPESIYGFTCVCERFYGLTGIRMSECRWMLLFKHVYQNDNDSWKCIYLHCNTHAKTCACAYCSKYTCTRKWMKALMRAASFEGMLVCVGVSMRMAFACQRMCFLCHENFAGILNTLTCIFYLLTHTCMPTLVLTQSSCCIRSNTK